MKKQEDVTNPHGVDEEKALVFPHRYNFLFRNRHLSTASGFTDEPTETFSDGNNEETSSKNSNKAMPMEMETVTVGYSIEEGLQPLELSGDGNDGKKRRQCKSLWGGRQSRLCSGLCLLAVLVIIVTVSVTVTKDKGDNGSSSTVDNPLIYDGGDGSSNGTGGNSSPPGPGDDNFVDQGLAPFSTLDPVNDLNMYSYQRPASSSPNSRLDPLQNASGRSAFPTNTWFGNLLRLGVDEQPTRDHRVYTMPYMVDVAPGREGLLQMNGLRIHPTRLSAATDQVTVTVDEPYAVSFGSAAPRGGLRNGNVYNGYSVQAATDLAVTLQWETAGMTTTLARGMPYVTIMYGGNDGSNSTALLPTLFTEQGLVGTPVVDRTKNLNCDTNGEEEIVQEELEFVVNGSNQRWLVFFSRPVALTCVSEQGGTTLQVTERTASEPLVIRTAVVFSSSQSDDDKYANLLRASSNTHPGSKADVSHAFNEQSDRARISFHWDSQVMKKAESGDENLLMFALPHHQDVLDTTSTSSRLLDICTTSLLGPVCLVKGPAVWRMYEELPPVDLRAPRPPAPKFVPDLAAALMEDIQYQIPDNFFIGAADTYFSSKTIARLARILVITEEMKELCGIGDGAVSSKDYADACSGLELPSEEDVATALEQLRSSVTVWVKNNTQAPFVYDTAWGGTVSCGCLYSGGVCTNVFPECPAFTDQGLNFGNGFYNDHHFHYGYLVYAAAVLSHFDAAWATANFENVLLLVRDFANPSAQDQAFPVFRTKDWFKGHSWASGITEPLFPNIMNQESSSEAIAAYEAVALFGKVMAANFEASGDAEKVGVAENIRNVGLVLTATEIRSTQQYWQIHSRGNNDSENSYPKQPYEAGVVGILWETMIHYTTWFGNSPYLIYGIQLLPLTPISEQRDNLEWAGEIYGRLAESCDNTCVSEGWSVQIFALLASLGHMDEAVQSTLDLNPSVYVGPGGNGHSKSNTLWYISTRAAVAEHELPVDLPTLPEVQILEITCSQPTLCTSDYLETLVEDHTCRSRIEWVINAEDLSENAACSKVAGEFDGCRNCNPLGQAYNDLDQEMEDMVSEEGTVELSCFQPANCTPAVLDSMAGDFSCRDRIKFLMDAVGSSETSACRQVAKTEQPAVCGPCNPPE